MNTFLFLALALLLPATGYADAPSPNAAALYVVALIDFPPPQAAQGEAVLRGFVSQLRQTAHLLKVELVQGFDRPNHYVLLETWQTRADFDKFEGSDTNSNFQTKIHPLLAAPIDERLQRSVL